jgi:hypothetical protein
VWWYSKGTSKTLVSMLTESLPFAVIEQIHDMRVQIARISKRDIIPELNPLTPNDLQRRLAVSPLKIKVTSKNMREKQIRHSLIHSVN